jgi:hypothetical protein
VFGLLKGTFASGEAGKMLTDAHPTQVWMVADPVWAVCGVTGRTRIMASTTQVREAKKTREGRSFG